MRYRFPAAAPTSEPSPAAVAPVAAGPPPAGAAAPRNIWVVAVGEPVPVEAGASDRLHRAGYLAHFLAEHGHRVTWWTSTFDHFRRKHLFDADHSLAINDRLDIRLLHGCGYRSNVSLARIRDHAQIARHFAAAARAEERRPDIIVAALPTIELCLEAARFGKEHGIPVIADMRNMWPDIFLEVLPKPFRFLAYPLCAAVLLDDLPCLPRGDRDHGGDGTVRRLGAAPRPPPPLSLGSRLRLRLRPGGVARGRA